MFRRTAWILGPLEAALLAATAAACCLSAPAGPILARCLAMLLLGVASAKGWGRLLIRDEDDAVGRMHVAIVVGFSLIVWSQEVGSCFGLLRADAQWTLWILLAVGGLFAGSWRRITPCERPAGWSSIVAPMLLAVASAPMVYFVGRRWSTAVMEWDAWSYHLYFPFRWVQDHRIDYVFVGFGPEFLTYFPCNVECLAAWLYEPAMVEWLAKTMGPLFVAWSAAALWQWSRRLGADRLGASLSCLALMALDETAQAGSGTGNDFASAAAFLSCLVFSEEARRETGFRSAILAGLAAGHFIGIKYSNLLYAPLAIGYFGFAWLRPIAPIAATRGRTARGVALWSAGAAAAGGYWYWRNWSQTGNPLFPAEVKLGSWTVLKGPLSRAAMYEGGWTHASHSVGALYSLAAEYLESSARLLNWRVSLLPFLLVAAGVVLLRAACRRRRLSAAQWATITAPPIMLWMFWRMQPYNTQIRYALPGMLLGVSSIGLAASTSSRPVRILTLLSFGAPLVLLVLARGVGVTASSLAGWTQDPATTEGVDLLSGWAIVAATAVVLQARLGRSVWPTFLGVAAATLLWLFLVVSPRTALELVEPPSSRRGMDSPLGTIWDQSVKQGWTALAALPHRRMLRVANVGNGIPYPLAGPSLNWRIVDLAPNSNQGRRLHDYFRDWGETESSRRRVRDRFPAYRSELDRTAWLKNLRSQEVDVVFITTIHPGERFAYEREMDDEKFPIEKRWCNELGFRLLAEGNDFRIYAVPKP